MKLNYKNNFFIITLTRVLEIMKINVVKQYVITYNRFK